MSPAQRRLLLLRRIAWAGAAIVLAITTLSAFIRLSRAGVGCEPWPQCHIARLEMPAGQLAALDSPAVSAARIAHRITASAALLLYIVLLVQLHVGPAARRKPARLAVAIVAVALFLAVLGRMSGDSRSAGVVMANLLAGFAMFALAVQLALSLRDRVPETMPPRVRAATWVALAFVVAQVVLGAALTALHDAGRCTASPVCLAHAGIGVISVLACIAVALSAWRSSVAPRAVGVLALTQVALGAVMLVTGVPLALALAHNVLAALLAGTLPALLPLRSQ
jgi:cytochrome c oxidase assembly protein subunit 15